LAWVFCIFFIFLKEKNIYKKIKKNAKNPRQKQVRVFFGGKLCVAKGQKMDKVLSYFLSSLRRISPPRWARRAAPSKNPAPSQPQPALLCGLCLRPKRKVALSGDWPQARVGLACRPAAAELSTARRRAAAADCESYPQPAAEPLILIETDFAPQIGVRGNCLPLTPCPVLF